MKNIILDIAQGRESEPERVREVQKKNRNWGLLVEERQDTV